MKTKHSKKQTSGLSSRPEQLSTDIQTTEQAPPAPAAAPQQLAEQTQPQSTRILPYVNFQQREENRALPTERVLELLRRWMPKQYELAEVVGKWIWITFPEAPAEQVRGQLSQFGFHWNNTRKCWQHPCGQFATEGSGADPRQKYGSVMASAARTADQVAA